MKYRETDMDISRDFFQGAKAAVDKAKDIEECILFMDKVKRKTDEVVIQRPTEQLRGATFTNKGPQLNDNRALFAQKIRNNARAAASVGNNQVPNQNRPKQNEADQER